MRSLLAIAAAMVASPVMAAGPGPCIAHAHDGAAAYKQEGDFGPMKRISHLSPYEHDDEVDHIDTKTPGGPWVWRVHAYILRMRDVDLSGDCTHVPADDLR